MIRQLILSTFSLLLATSAFAQMPEAVQGSGLLGGMFSLQKLACADQDAGTITFGAFSGSSSDIDPATPIFLCLGDTYQINHNGDADLTGDPVGSTAPGITYAFYSGDPTVTGPNLTTVLTDPNLIPNVGGATPIFVTGSTGLINGDILLTNTGALQGVAALGGDGGPLQLWFAPITIDEFDTNGYENDAITMEQGPCVNANINEAFSVVYLNELTASNQISTTTCSGAFTINGGLAEFDGSDYVAIAVINMDNPVITGVVTSGSATHGDQVTFTVPEEGNYVVVVEDGKNCEAVIPFVFTEADPLEMIASTENVPTAGSQCIDITANNFDEIVTMQTTIDYDETILTFTGFQNFNPNLPDLMGSVVNNGMAVVMSWFDPTTNGISLADNSLLFQICFDVIGTAGDVATIEFNQSVIIDEITNPCGVIGFMPTNGSISITLDAFDIDLVGQNETCSGLNNGEWTVTANGGQAPFTVTWVGATTGAGGPAVINTNGGTFNATGLMPDDYTVIVTDNMNNVVNEMITIDAGFGFGVSPEYTYPTCFSDCNGSITVDVVVNGIVIIPGPEYSFLWSTGETTQTVTGLCNATINYGITVTGPGMCAFSASESVSGAVPIMANPTITDATCSGAGDGEIMLNITGGAGGYFTDWVNPTIQDGSTNINGLNDDIYEVTITDMNMCTATFFIEVEAIKVLEIAETIVGLGCNGDCDGSIAVIASTSGGAPSPYTFNWIATSGIGTPVDTDNTSTISNLCTGIFQVFLTDADNCSVNETYTINEPEVLVVTLFETTNETCAVGNDGTATIEVAGGTYPYFYDWDVPGQTDSIAVSLSAGMYTVTVMDANNCSQTFDVSINAPVPPIITALVDDNVPCDNSVNGTLTVEVMDGGSPITGVEWLTTGETTNTITGLLPGEYIVIVTAADGCTTIDTALVIAPEPLTVVSITEEDTNCPGTGGGLVSIVLAGGIQPYNFTWSNGAGGDNVSTITGGDIVAGVYVTTVTYGIACPSLELSGTVGEPPHIEGAFSGIDGVSCYNLSGVPADGEATVLPNYADDIGNTQGQTWNVVWQNLETPPTVFFQESGVLTSSANNLPQDEQFVIVSDGQCFDTLSVNIPAPAPLVALGSTVDVSCFGDIDGSITVMGEGGTGDYMYNWSTGDVNITTVEMLPPGDVTVVITDENNCNFTFAASVGEPEPFTAFTLLETQDSVSCFEGNDALISIGTNGGNPGILTYMWEDGIALNTQSTAENIGAGSWSVTVTDEKGCTDELTTLVTQPDPITFEYSVDTIQCFGEDAEFRIDTVIGGTVDGYVEYRFSLDIIQPKLPVNTAFDLEAGDYIVSIFDNNDCEVSDTFSLTQPNPLTVDLPEVIEIELGDTMTQLLPGIINDFPLDSILWTPIASGLSNDTILNPFVRNSIDDQSFKLRLVDINGCMGMDEVRIEIDRNRNIYIPNVFSPNRDGYNDDFGVFGCLGVSRVVAAQVYDRWGELVADGTDLFPECESVNGTVIWDGTFRGKVAPDGVYVYAIDIEFLDGKRLVYRGDVTVLK
ncbi:MAG: gliding motility-associated-like protein [Saprospiraceae bacterium]|jgi:gliding motility-associated-like protein